MRAEVAIGERRAGVAIALLTARRAVRSAAVWGVLFGALVANEALGYHSNFPTAASREQFAQTFGQNHALAAVIGPARRSDTIGGFVAWRVFGLLIIVGAIWGLLAATRLLRGEEDAGRWELLLAGRTTRRLAAVQGLAGLAAGFLVLWGLTAAATVAAGTRADVGFSVSSCVFYATAATASAAMFLALGALSAELAPTRRQANGLAAAMLGAAYLIRLVADSGGDRAWLRWASPLGWVENLRPLTGSRPLALVPIVGLTTAAAGAAVFIAGRRDVAAGVLGRAAAAHPSMRLLGGSTVLVVRLERWVAVAWAAGLAVLALIFGVVAQSASGAKLVGATIEQTVGQLGGEKGGAAAWIGYEFLYIAALVAFVAAGQIAALRSEEADGHLDHLLARRVSRATWLAGRLAFAAAFVVLTGLAVGIGGWVGVAARNSNVTFGEMLQAGVNVSAPALFVLGAGTLLYGIAPRFAVPIVNGFVLWSFGIEIIGSSITTNRWLLDTSVLAHLGPVPATGIDWVAITVLGGLGGLAALAGLAAFNRRDLAAA